MILSIGKEYIFYTSDNEYHGEVLDVGNNFIRIVSYKNHKKPYFLIIQTDKIEAYEIVFPEEYKKKYFFLETFSNCCSSICEIELSKEEKEYFKGELFDTREECLKREKELENGRATEVF